MKVYYEWGVRQINKRNEELCGDSVVVARHSDSVTLALSDGLGSGVQANILATLTTQIAMQLLENELPLGEVVQTLSETLPVCATRDMAYSTFAIAQFFTQGSARVVMFDSPPAIWLRRRKIRPVNCEERTIDGKTIHQCVLDLKQGDWVVFVSDGVLNSGIGGAYPLGWGWDQAASFIERRAHAKVSAQDLADEVAEAVGELYVGPPGDDVSIVVIKARRKQFATVLTGPPRDPAECDAVISRFLKHGGRLAVCGGTTAKIVARHMGVPLEVDLKTVTNDVPARAYIEGIELVTEGVLTLTSVRELLRSNTDRKSVRFRNDGAAALFRLLLSVDHVHFIVGQAVNPAHQNPELPGQLGIRLSVVRGIVEELRKRDKEASLEAA